MLASNLLLQNTIISLVETIPSELEVVIDNPESEMKETITGEEQTLELKENIALMENCSRIITKDEKINEDDLIKTHLHLNGLTRFDANIYLDSALVNLCNACNEFEAAMNSMGSLNIFRHLFNSLEILSNLDGEDRKGSELDERISFLTGEPQEKCKNWHTLNSRVKHLQRDLKDIQTLTSGLGDLNNYILDMRKVVSKLILDKI